MDFVIVIKLGGSHQVYRYLRHWASMELVRWKKYIVKNGKSYYLGLPQEWITSRGLDKDCEIDLVLKADGSLLLEPIREEKNA